MGSEMCIRDRRTAGLTLDDHMLYTIFIDALPAEYEVEVGNLASRDSIGRDDVIKAVGERHHRLSGNRKKGSNAGHADHAMFAGGGGSGGRGKGGGGGGHGKGGGRGKGKIGRWGQQGRGGKGTNEVGGGSATAAGGYGGSANATEGSTPETRCYRSGKKGHWKADCTEELCSRCQGRGHAANVCPACAEKRCSRCNGRVHAADICPSSKEEAVLAVSNDDVDDGTVQASASKAEEAGECSDALSRMGEGESAWQV